MTFLAGPLFPHVACLCPRSPCEFFPWQAAPFFFTGGIPRTSNGFFCADPFFCEPWNLGFFPGSSGLCVDSRCSPTALRKLSPGFLWALEFLRLFFQWAFPSLPCDLSSGRLVGLCGEISRPQTPQGFVYDKIALVLHRDLANQNPPLFSAWRFLFY